MDSESWEMWNPGMLGSESTTTYYEQFELSSYAWEKLKQTLEQFHGVTCNTPTQNMN